MPTLISTSAFAVDSKWEESKVKGHPRLPNSSGQSKWPKGMYFFQLSQTMINPIGIGDSICDHNKCKVQLYIAFLNFQSGNSNRC